MRFLRVNLDGVTVRSIASSSSEIEFLVRDSVKNGLERAHGAVLLSIAIALLTRRGARSMITAEDAEIQGVLKFLHGMREDVSRERGGKHWGRKVFGADIDDLIAISTDQCTRPSDVQYECFVRGLPATEAELDEFLLQRAGYSRPSEVGPASSTANGSVDVPPIAVGEITSDDDDRWLGVFRHYQCFNLAEAYPEVELRRWISVTQEQLRSGQPISCYDRVFVAEIGSKVCGYCIVHSYPNQQWTMISYLGAKGQDVEARDGICASLFRYVTNVLSTDAICSSCQRFFFEAADPRVALDKRSVRRALARLRRFNRISAAVGYEMRIAEHSYKQPRIDLRETEIEPRLALGVVERLVSPVWTSEQLRSLLRAIYTAFYTHDHYEDATLQSEYQAYAHALFQSESRNIRGIQRLLRYRDLAQVARKPAID